MAITLTEKKNIFADLYMNYLVHVHVKYTFI